MTRNASPAAFLASGPAAASLSHNPPRLDAPQRVSVLLDAADVGALDALAARLGGASRAAALRYVLRLGLDTARPEDAGSCPA